MLVMALLHPLLIVNIGTMTGKSREVAEMLQRREVAIACE